MDRHAADIMQDTTLDPLWRSFISHHLSDVWWLEVVDTFGEAIRLLYPRLEFNKRLEDYRTGIRFHDKDCDIQMECQPGVNTPPKTPGRVRGPHIDNPVELVAGLLYMRPPEDDVEGGGLDVCRLVKPYKMHGKAEIDDEYVETVATVPYRANTLVMFVNSMVSVHSVRPRPVNPHHRLLVNFAMELPKPLFKLPK